jgi:predicted ester cyclase
MSVEENKAVTRLTLEQVINRGNVGLIPELFSPTYVHCSASGLEIKGHDGWEQSVLRGLAAFPDMFYTIDDLVAEGDKVVCRFTATGTHKGEYMGISPTGKRITVNGVFINRFEEGKVVETWAMSNPMLLFQQLGVVPPGYEFTKR